MILALASLGYVNYYYLTHIIAPYHKYPEEVAKPLRKASYYMIESPDPKLALKWLREALRVIEETGMHPFSDEVIGVKLRLAGLFEKYHHHHLAIEVLETIRKDCFRFVDLMGDKHIKDGQRTRILKKTIEIGIKLGELYSGPNIDDQEAAEAVLISAVETMLQERMRRDKLGTQEGEEDWPTDEENGATLEALGTQYEATNKHHLAAPLYLQAINWCPPKSCHRVILMNNLAASLAQQSPPKSFNSPTQASQLKSTSSKSPPSYADYRDQASLWAKHAIALSQSIAPPDRTEECDVGCVVATHNLGEFAEMSGKVAEASRLYYEAESLAKGMKYEDGIAQARQGLARLAGEKPEIGR
ncbi:hypothetical protein EJ08DRAFT_593691 [Tothia fuscella]|uniref:Uncharacterized protein n=1 Tax=Tothia fuscella TaxID=1048955 RepID=A0A9P4NL18_9PEZI|nr:hypothetical protein EJ08DRAFT_593691 [Tothia fuscella]